MASTTSRPRTSASARTDLAALAAKYNKKFGEGTLVTADHLRELGRISSGSLAFDCMMNGGWVQNQWNEIIGEPSHGKTALILKTVATNQALNPKFQVLWVASERYVPDWAAAIGVDNSRVQLANTNIMEEAYDVCTEALENRACDLIVIDSLADLSPATEDEGEFADWQVGLGARLTNKFMRKSSAAGRRSLVDVEDRPCTGIIVNQWRYQIGVTRGDPRTTPNGKQKDFSFFTRVEVRRDEFIEYQKRKVGISMKARTMKNKAGPVARVAALTLYFDHAPGFRPGEFDIAAEVAAMAIVQGVVDGVGTSWLKYGGDKWNGGEKFTDAVREDVGLQQSLWNAVLLSTGVRTPAQRPGLAPRSPQEPRKALKLKRASA